MLEEADEEYFKTLNLKKKVLLEVWKESRVAWIAVVWTETNLSFSNSRKDIGQDLNITANSLPRSW